MGVRLLQGSEQVQHIPLDLGSPLIHASSADPHVIILTEDGQLILLTLREIKQNVSRLTVQRPTNFSLVRNFYSEFRRAIIDTIIKNRRLRRNPT